MIVVNFKNYISGKKVLERIKILERKLGKKIIFCPSTADLSLVVNGTRATVFAQHVDLEGKGGSTGKSLVKSVKDSGAEGTLLNHSERRISYEVLKKTVKECKKMKLRVIVCANSLTEVKKFKKLRPWAIAFEEPKLIGSGKSITEYETKKVKDFSKILKGSGIKALCGAGISNGEDYKEAKKLGCQGVLIASALAKTKGVKFENILRSFK